MWVASQQMVKHNLLLRKIMARWQNLEQICSGNREWYLCKTFNLTLSDFIPLQNLFNLTLSDLFPPSSVFFENLLPYFQLFPPPNLRFWEEKVRRSLVTLPILLYCCIFWGVLHFLCRIPLPTIPPNYKKLGKSKNICIFKRSDGTQNTSNLVLETTSTTVFFQKVFLWKYQIKVPNVLIERWKMSVCRCWIWRVFVDCRCIVNI